MEIIAKVLIGIVALEHVYILWMEMFAWETKGKETFKGAMPPDMFKPTKGMAANQGLYNGFLAAGLIWSLFIQDAEWSKNVAIFFLGCVAVAGVFGALTASKKIFFVQACPALIALAFVIFGM
ncbi:DUF1304 domain-containing protein [Arcticibacterium luteifluviistationis]|uniref:DUF1304 domain-containing protein n=1 Tax=Arcticibacterium luteifluviistationis TaxID=1784714 RepID=A0A2Z4G942_9BACT|nr:DUF1304 domain-containing protein [Arcticibacterium luteifluviistationis]AWV97453.1 DUF1304 domain-containing protein [Arcticibacterium luteifluviistationis]